MEKQQKKRMGGLEDKIDKNVERKPRLSKVLLARVAAQGSLAPRRRPDFFSTNALVSPHMSHFQSGALRY